MGEHSLWIAGAALGVPTVELLVGSIGHGLLSKRNGNKKGIIVICDLSRNESDDRPRIFCHFIWENVTFIRRICPPRKIGKQYLGKKKRKQRPESFSNAPGKKTGTSSGNGRLGCAGNWSESWSIRKLCMGNIFDKFSRLSQSFHAFR